MRAAGGRAACVYMHLCEGVDAVSGPELQLSGRTNRARGQGRVIIACRSHMVRALYDVPQGATRTPAPTSIDLLIYDVNSNPSFTYENNE